MTNSTEGDGVLVFDRDLEIIPALKTKLQADGFGQDDLTLLC
jgi:hypothetical protein